MPLVYSGPARQQVHWDVGCGTQLETWVTTRTASRTASSPATAAIVGVNAVPLQMLVLYGSYRSDRKGIRLAQRICEELQSYGDAAELIDARTVGLPIIDRMYKEYALGEAPAQMEALATKIRQADAFAFVVGDYNWGVQPGLKNLTDHFLEEWFWSSSLRNFSIVPEIRH
jgi:hypothetical protein